ncbi:MAG: response regulator [Thiohalophilus sp.]|uniref:response regulator n=1 Tax=Thiohalophilus sp. TaxID=3028392 RepID=UPI0028709E26|nr:response regulator [Thiohalophilus sp.]MDR9436012.1 response regulator [Thiohalophilus sp.]
MTARRILLVEDNPDDQMLVLRALKKNHMDSEVTVVDDGVEALDYLFAEGKYQDRFGESLPTLMLLDIKLPRLDGHDVLRQLRADSRTRHLPVVVMTSSSEEEDIRKSYELGANSYIRKPIDSGQFTSTVTQLSHYWLKLNQCPYV